MSHDILYRDMSVTYCASIWLLSWMSLLLILKPTCFRKCLMTYFTGICLQKLASPQKGFSPKMCTPRNFYRNICVGSRCISNDSGKLKLKEDYHHLYLHKYVFKYVGIILGKKLSSVPKVGLINILYQNVCYCQGKAVKPCQFLWEC